MGRIITKTKSGGIVGFNSDREAQIRSLKVHFSPIQSGSGDPSPDNVRPIDAISSFAVSKSKNLWDGKYEQGILDSSGNDTTNDIGYRCIGYISVISGSKIYVKYTPPNNGSNIRVYEYDENKNYIKNSWRATGSFPLDSNTCYLRFYMDSNYTKSYKDGDLFIGYNDDITSIPFTFPTVGKNLVNPRTNPVWQNSSNYTVNADGTVTIAGSDGRGWNSTRITPLELPAGTYTFSWTGSPRVQFATSEDDYATVTSYTKAFTFTLQGTTGIKWKHSGSSTDYPMIVKVQIESGSTATEYEPYYPEKVYGGYVDLISGEVWKTWEKISNTWDNFVFGADLGTHTRKTFTFSTNKGNRNYGQCLTNISGVYYVSNSSDTTHFYLNERGDTFYSIMPNDTGDDTVIEFVYPLNTPELVATLPPLSLKTFVERNTFWSNVDSVEIEYDYYLNDMVEVYRRRILMNTPHVEETSGTVASFQADMIAKLKECKTSFLPMQEGSGDPSPTNIRPISGFNNMKLYRNNKKVVWNQWLLPLTEDNWRSYNTNYVSVSFSDGIATSEWLDTKTGYAASVRNKVGTLQQSGEIWYVSYMVKPSVPNLVWGVEFLGGRQVNCIQSAPADVWQQCSCVGTYYRGTRNYTYITNMKTSTITSEYIGMTAQSKAPILINLTQMFGAGNEPTKEEFEAQCLLNGVDLTSYHEYDEGTEREWVTGDTDVYSVEFPAAGKNKWTFGNYTETKNDVLFEADGSSLHISGTNSGGSTQPTSWNTHHITLPAGTYTISSNENCSNLPSAHGMYINFKLGGVGNSYTAINPSIYNKTFTLEETTDIYGYVGVYGTASQYHKENIDVTVNIQIESGDTATDYEPYNQTIYGGYVDWKNGEIVQTHKLLTITGDEGITYSVFNNSIYTGGNLFLTDSVSGTTVYGICSTAPTTTTTSKYINTGWIRKAYNDREIQFYNVTTNWGLSEATSAALISKFQEWNNAGTPLQIYYQLAEPIHYPITPQILRTLKGTNNWFNSANGETTIKYWTH